AADLRHQPALGRLLQDAGADLVLERGPAVPGGGREGGGQGHQPEEEKRQEAAGRQGSSLHRPLRRRDRRLYHLAGSALRRPSCPRRSSRTAPSSPRRTATRPTSTSTRAWSRSSARGSTCPPTR